MRLLKFLTNRSLLALKIALDGFQRYEQSAPDVADYFKRIVDAEVGPITDLNLWGVRSLINQEDERRLKQATVIRAADPVIYDDLKKLTRTQLKVLDLLSRGHRAEEIAELMGIAWRTVYSHKQHIATKLGLGSIKELNRYAIEHLKNLTL